MSIKLEDNKTWQGPLLESLWEMVYLYLHVYQTDFFQIDDLNLN